MRKLLLIAAALAAATQALAVGTVTEAISQLGTTGAYVLTFSWTGDVSSGTVPVTAATGNCNATTLICTNIQGPLALAGLAVLSVESTPATPAPTNGYSIALLDSSGADILGGTASSASSTVGQAWAPAVSAPPLTLSGLSLSITGNSAPSAKGKVYVFIAPLTIAWPRGGSGGGGGGGGGSSAVWGAIIGTLNNQSDLATALASRNTTGNAGTASALAAVPAQCSGAQFATGIAASGAANCGTPAGGGVAVCSASNSGSPNALTCTATGFTLVTGSLLNLFVTTATTSTAVTLNVNSGGAVTVLRGTGNAPAIGQLGPSAEPLLLSYNGTAYQMINDPYEAGASTCLVLSRTSFPWTIDINTSCVPELTGANTWTGYNNFSGGLIRLPESVVGSLPTASANAGKEFIVTDGSAANDCTTGSGSTVVNMCRSNGTSWIFVGSSGSGPPTIASRYIGVAANFAFLYNSTPGGTAQTADQLTCGAYVAPVPWTVTKALSWMVTGAPGGTASAVGIYSAAGSLIVQSTNVLAAGGQPQVFALASTTLAQGTGYWICAATESATTSVRDLVDSADTVLVYNASAVIFGVAANPATLTGASFAFPATLGTVTAATAANQVPLVILSAN